MFKFFFRVTRSGALLWIWGARCGAPAFRRSQARVAAICAMGAVFLDTLALGATFVESGGNFREQKMHPERLRHRGVEVHVASGCAHSHTPSRFFQKLSKRRRLDAGGRTLSGVPSMRQQARICAARVVGCVGSLGALSFCSGAVGGGIYPTHARTCMRRHAAFSRGVEPHPQLGRLAPAPSTWHKLPAKPTTKRSAVRLRQRSSIPTGEGISHRGTDSDEGHPQEKTHTHSGTCGGSRALPVAHVSGRMMSLEPAVVKLQAASKKPKLTTKEKETLLDHVLPTLVALKPVGLDTCGRACRPGRRRSCFVSRRYFGRSAAGTREGARVRPRSDRTFSPAYRRGRYRQVPRTWVLGAGWAGTCSVGW